MWEICSINRSASDGRNIKIYTKSEVIQFLSFTSKIKKDTQFGAEVLSIFNFLRFKIMARTWLFSKEGKRRYVCKQSPFRL